MDLELRGRNAVVTGASMGIGLAVAGALAREGARVLVGARRETPELARLRAEYDVRFAAVDLSTVDGPAALLEHARAAFGRVDLLVNNVGASEPAATVLDFDDAQWQRILDVTLLSAVRTVRAAVPLMPADDGAAIVTIASVNATLPMGMIAPYGAAKAALVNVARTWAEELGHRGIRVNSISPGPVRTPLWTAAGGFAEIFAAQAGITPAEVMDTMLPESMAISLGRVAEPEDVADLALFLCSPRARYITGVNYRIDGGMLKTA